MSLYANIVVLSDIRTNFGDVSKRREDAATGVVGQNRAMVNDRVRIGRLPGRVDTYACHFALEIGCEMHAIHHRELAAFEARAGVAAPTAIRGKNYYVRALGEEGTRQA